MGSHPLLQGVFPTQVSCRWILYHLRHQGSPEVKWQVCHNWFEVDVGLSLVQTTLVVPGGPTLEGMIILPLFSFIK